MCLVLLGAKGRRFGVKGLSLRSRYLIKDSDWWQLEEMTTNKIISQTKVASNHQPAVEFGAVFLSSFLL